jgi:hypothetical protein
VFSSALFLGCSSSDEHDHSGHGHEYHMKPRKNDDLNTLMHKSTSNMNTLIDGLISNDKKKLFIGTSNLSAIADFASKLPLPENENQNDKYSELYKNQRNILASIRKSFLNNRQDEAAKALADLLLNCISCHNQYRP